MSHMTIALLGQPNSGKSTLFNRLTGSKQHVGNWPGKTVEKKEGTFSHGGTDYTLVDLPGAYGLSANSEEEVITREYIAGGEADLIAVMADASQLNRSLFMLSDCVGIRVPVVLIMNMMDVAEKQHKKIDIDKLQESLQIPVIPIVAADKDQYGSLYEFLEKNEKKAIIKDHKLEEIYKSKIGRDYEELLKLVPKEGIGVFSPMWLSGKLLEKDERVKRLVKEHTDSETYGKILNVIGKEKDGTLVTGHCKFDWIDEIIREYVKQKTTQFKRSKFDRLATSPKWGKLIAIGMILLGLTLSMCIGGPLMGLFGMGTPIVGKALAGVLLDMGVSDWLVSLVCGALLTSVSFAFQMASFVFGISLVFGFMEDVGYMARVSYVFDSAMSKIGLQGKAIMPFLVSFGCNIGGVSGSRMIDSWGQRVMTIALSWVVPCASTWGVIGLVSGTFFGAGAIVVVLSLFLVALLHLYITYRIFRKSLYTGNDNTGMIMELPPYHKPHWKSLFASVMSKMGNVLKRALVVISVISIVFWALAYTPDGNIEASFIYKIGTAIEPVTQIFGLPWQLFMAFVASAMGKESALGVLASLFSFNGIWGAVESQGMVDTALLGSTMLSMISKPEALAFLFAFFFNMPCLMALAATAEETHSRKWTIKIALYYIVFALLISTVVYHIGLLIF